MNLLPLNSLEYLQEQAAAGHREARFLLAYYYFRGLGVPKDVVEGFTLLLAAAKAGHLEAQYAVGCCYCDGAGVAENQRVATRWFRAAAEGGHLAARYNVAARLRQGRGVRRNLDAALAGYLEVAATGDADGQYWAATIYADRKQWVEAEEYFALAVKSGHLDAMCALGEVLTAVDRLEESFAMYSRAAELGDSLGQLRVGYMLFCRIGVPTDQQAGIEFYEKAAEQDEPCALWNLGLCYEVGDGVPEDPREAYWNYFRAASVGHKQAKRKLTRRLLKACIECDRQGPRPLVRVRM